MMIIISKLLIRHYRPAVSSCHQEKILSIRAELSALGVATGRSRAKRNRQLSGTAGIEMGEAIRKLRAADLEINCGEKVVKVEGEEGKVKTFGHNSLILNVKIKLLKEQSNGLRGVLNLPNPELLNCKPSILVFVPPNQADLALNAGANIVGGDELVSGLISGTLAPFNRCLASKSMLGTVMKVARVLGPKGLMPNVKTGTLVEGQEIGEAVRNCLQSVPFKIEKNAGLLNMSLGSLKGDDTKLIENLAAVLDHLKKLGGASSRYVERIYLSTRGYPGILIKI